MREIISLTRQSLQVVTTRARKVIFGYLFSLLAISSLDAAALFLLSRLFSTDSINNDSITSTSTNSKLLVIIVFLFMLRSALSTISTWISLKEFADQEVQIGQKNLTALHLAPLEERIDLNVSDYFTAVDRGPTSLIQAFLISVVTICAELISGIVISGVVLFVQPATVALEWDASEIDLEKVRSALIAANLEEYLDSDLNDQKLSEKFNKMSGGQRQRLGLARAL